MQTVVVLVSNDSHFASDLLGRGYRLIAQIFEREQEYFFFHATDTLLAYIEQLPYHASYALDSVTAY